MDVMGEGVVPLIGSIPMRKQATMYFKMCLIALFFTVGIANAMPSLQVRQSGNPCSSDITCNPDSLGNQSIPKQYVECSNGQCSCNECFMLNSTINRCYLMPPCTNYDNTSLT